MARTTVPPELRVRIVPIDSVKPLVHNPRRGDVDFIREGLELFDQYAPLIVRAETSDILKGNNTWHACKAAGRSHVAIVERSVPDDAVAKAFAMRDNNASDRATYDPTDLAAALAELDALPDLELEPGATAVPLHVAGYDEDDLAAALKAAEQLDQPIARPAPADDEPDDAPNDRSVRTTVTARTHAGLTDLAAARGRSLTEEARIAIQNHLKRSKR
jgi:hypothetical protein